MRILALGIRLPDPAIDNFDWACALSFYDYDAMIVDPAGAVSQLVEGVTKGAGDYKTYDDVPIADGPTSADAVGLTELLHRRRDETERLLARGGVVVVFGYPDVPHPRVAGFTGCHRYYWLPAPPGTDYGPDFVKAASGRHLNIVDFEHPFASYLDARRNDVLYRASFAEGAAGFPHSRVIGRSDGGTAVAIELGVAGGRVVFLPALPTRVSPSERSRMASNLVASIRNTLLTSAEGSEPDWIEDAELPGIDEAQRRIEDAESKLDELEAELEAARNEYRAAERYRRILWQEGKYGFDLPVRDALQLLGFRQYSTADQPAHFALRSEQVFVETESNTEAVGMDPHYRLRQRLEAKIVDDARKPPRGLLVINGFRELPPDEREQQYVNSLRVAAESLHYCILQATDLFAEVRNKLEDRGDAAAFCQRLMETDGIFERTEAAAKESEAAPAVNDGE